MSASAWRAAFFRGASRFFEGLFDFLVPGPRLTPLQAELAARAAEENAAARDFADADRLRDAERDWLIFEADRRRQQEDLAVELGLPTAPPERRFERDAATTTSETDTSRPGAEPGRRSRDGTKPEDRRGEAERDPGTTASSPESIRLGACIRRRDVVGLLETLTQQTPTFTRQRLEHVLRRHIEDTAARAAFAETVRRASRDRGAGR